MNEKLKQAQSLLETKDLRKIFQGICLILEVQENSPKELSPLLNSIANAILKPIATKVEKSLGINFEEE